MKKLPWFGWNRGESWADAETGESPSARSKVHLRADPDDFFSFDAACGAQLTSNRFQNEVRFGSPGDARAAGWEPCKRCVALGGLT